MVGWLVTKELDWMSEDSAVTCFDVLSRNSPAGAEGKSVTISLCLSGLSLPCLSWKSAWSHLPRDSHFFTDGARKKILPEVSNSWAREGPVLSCPALSCPVLPCPVLPCPVLPCPSLSCPVLSCPGLSYPALSCPVLSCPALPYPALPYPVLLCPTLPCPILPCPVLSCPIPSCPLLSSLPVFRSCRWLHFL